MPLLTRWSYATPQRLWNFASRSTRPAKWSSLPVGPAQDAVHLLRGPCTCWRPDRPPRGAIYFPIGDARTIDANKTDDISVAYGSLGVCRALADSVGLLCKWWACSIDVATRYMVVAKRRTASATDKYDPRLIQWRLRPLPQQQVRPVFVFKLTLKITFHTLWCSSRRKKNKKKHRGKNSETKSVQLD